MTAHTPGQMPDLTRNQALVFGALADAQTPMSAYTILDHLRDEGFRAPLQVYRALEKLLKFGLVHRLDSLNAFVACSHEQCHNAGLIAFAICDGCSTVSEFADPSISQRITAWSNGNTFKVSKTTIEIHGTCEACQAA